MPKGINWFVGALVIAVTACSGMDYAMQTYSGIQPIKFSAYGKNWRVFDKPETGIMMITPSLGDAAVAGAAEGATLYLAGDMDAPVEVFQATAQRYLDSSGRGCQITSGRLVVDPQWEFSYSC